MNRNFVIFLIIILIIIFSYIIFEFFKPISYEKLNPIHRFMAKIVNNKYSKCVLMLPQDEQKKISQKQLAKCISPIEKVFVKRVFNINPKDLGFTGPYFGLNEPDNFTKIDSVTLNYKNNPLKISTNYLPDHIYNDFLKMNETMQKDINKKLFIQSAYRSSALQGQLFFYYLVKENGYSLLENAKWIAMPGYSEHNSSSNTAIDLINQDGINGDFLDQTDLDFENLDKFKILIIDLTTGEWEVKEEVSNIQNHSFEEMYKLNEPEENKEVEKSKAEKLLEKGHNFIDNFRKNWKFYD